MSVGVHEFWSFMLIFARVTALCVTAPVFGSRSVPPPVKVGLAAILALALLPVVGPQVGHAPTNLLTLAGQVAAETAVGLCMGFFVQLVFTAIQIAGHFLDTQMGFGIINVLNPFSQEHNSAMGQFLFQLGLTLFLLMGGHLLLIGTLASSFTVILPGGAQFAGSLSQAFSDVVSQMFAMAFRIAIPAAAVLLVVDVAFAIVARVVPQMNVFIVGMPAKILVGLLTIALVLPALALAVGQMVPAAIAGAESLVQAAR